MDLTLLETLRHKIVTAKAFEDVFSFFYDYFGENPEFFDAGIPTEDDQLIQMLGQIGGAIFKTDKVRLDSPRLFRVAEYDFIHGGMLINGAMANVLYCDDLKVGIVVVHRPNAKPSTHFARFSAEMLAPGLSAEASKFKN